ncbi:MAG: undecaprenyl-diphosphate phosphatase [Pseudomonadota bacterium]|nr:undecaprenyl-diphosphate phosphatase [Pseudomonadota bacterium]
MSIALLIQAALLGVVEGLTEFLPVSSTGHLLIAGRLLDFDGISFNIVIQVGAILAVCWVYRERLMRAAFGLFVLNDARRAESWHFSLVLLMAFLPAMVFGAVAYRFIIDVLFDPDNLWVIFIALILGGIAILVIERRFWHPRFERVDDFTYPLALKIGLVQCLSLVPGVSRAGATIMGALTFGVDRKAATEFSFFLAIPTMVAATAYDLFMHWSDLDFSDGAAIAVGFVVSFFVAMIVVRTCIGFITRYGFASFAWYRIGLGLTGLIWLAL